jgi:hypothetical protein
VTFNQLGGALVGIELLLLPLETARAQTPSRAAGSPAAAAGLADRIRFKGRLFTRVEYQQFRASGTGAPIQESRLEMSVPSGRAGLRAIVVDGVTLVVEAELTGRPDIRDGYVQVKGKRWYGRVGRFKMPISAVSLESIFVLPLARRGWLEEMLSEAMLITGRREGLVVGFHGGGYWDPAFAGMVAQSARWIADADDPLTMRGAAHLTTVGRFSVKPSGVELGIAGQRRVTYAGGEQGAVRERPFWTAAIDAAMDVEFERTGIRLWADAFAGSSWFDARNLGLADEAGARQTASFLGGRALAAFRWGGLTPSARYLEVFAGAALLDPGLSVVSDVFAELVVGLNIGSWRRVRLTAQLEQARTARNFPESLFRALGTPAPQRFSALIMQCGAVF